MSIHSDRSSSPRKRSQGSTRVPLSVLVLILGLLPLSLLAQEPPPPVPPVPSEQSEATRERIEEALEELDEEIEDQLDELDEVLSESDGNADVRRELRIERERARREVMKARERVRREMRGRRPDSKVSVGDSIRIERGELARDLVVIGGSIHSDGDVTGDCVAIGGSVYVDGEVTGDVVAVGGIVELGDNAEVLGDVTAVGGGVVRADGAQVLGEVNEVAFGPAIALGSMDWGDWDNWGDWDRVGDWGSPFMWGGFGFVWELFKLVMWLVLGSFVILVGGRSVENIRAKAASAPWASLLVGLALEILLLPVLVIVTIILVISIVGILLVPVLWLMVPFALLIAALVGITSVSVAAGRWIGGRLGKTIESPYAALALGLVVIYALSLFADLLQVGGGFLFFFAFMFAVVGGLVKLAAWTMGLGAVVLNAFGGSRFDRSGDRYASRGTTGTSGDEPPPVPPLPAVEIDSTPSVDDSDLEGGGDEPPKD